MIFVYFMMAPKRIMNSIYDINLRQFLSGDLFFIPRFSLSLLNPTAVRQFSSLDKETADNKIKPLSVGDFGPDFVLSPVGDFHQKIGLKSLVEKSPFTVLNFGSYTWPPWVDLSRKIQEISEKYKKDAQVVSVYIREFHAEDGWAIPHNTQQGICYFQPKTLEERVKIAKEFLAKQKVSLELYLDQIDNNGAMKYMADPERLYILDKNLRIFYVGGKGPHGYNPWEVEEFLKTKLGY